MRIALDTAKCTGHARCAAVAPQLFTLDDDGYSNLPGMCAVPQGLEDVARLGVDSCPEGALSIVEDREPSA